MPAKEKVASKKCIKLGSLKAIQATKSGRTIKKVPHNKRKKKKKKSIYEYVQKHIVKKRELPVLGKEKILIP